MRKLLPAFLFCIMLSMNLIAQDQHIIDSLKKVILITKEDTTKVNSLLDLANEYYLSNPDTAILICEDALSISTESKYQNGLSQSNGWLGYLVGQKGDITKALVYFNKSLCIQEEIGDKKGMAESFNNIGTIYHNQGDITKALVYYHKDLAICEEIGDKEGMASSFNNIGTIYYNQGDITKALVYYNKSLTIREEIGDKKGMAESFNNIGYIYDNQSDITKALVYYNKSLTIREEIGDKEGMAESFNNIGSLYFENNDIDKAKRTIDKGYKLSKELGYPENIEACANWLKQIYQKQGNYKKAFEYYQEEILMRDSIQNEENYKATQKQQAKYEYQKQAAVDSVAHHKAMEIKDLSLAKKEEETKRQQVVIYSFIAGFIIIIVFSILLFRMFLQKKKANIKLAQQNEEIAAQRDEIETQRDTVTEQRDHISEIHEEITDSINYAKRIQAAVLPSDKNASDILGEHFIVFRPHSVVSGDFYWATKTDEWTIVTAADCTGHGVPGAFMSMLGVSFLNEIVRKKDVTSSAEVLNQLRASVIEALKQTGEQGTQKDGMDMSIIAISNDLNPHTQTHSALWAGANNPIWIIRSENVSKDYEEKADAVEFIKGDSMPVAVHEIMDDFTNHELTLNIGDLLYLFSDGYPDQFGGKKGKKFMYKPFKRLLVENSNKPMTEQKEALETTLNNWMSYDGKKFEQIDDITVVGLKI